MLKYTIKKKKIKNNQSNNNKQTNRQTNKQTNKQINKRIKDRISSSQLIWFNLDRVNLRATSLVQQTSHSLCTLLLRTVLDTYDMVKHSFLSYWLLLLCFSEVHGSEICYGDLGCFSNDPPFNNTNGKLPNSPDDMSIRHHFFTRQNRDGALVAHNRQEVVKNIELLMDATRPLKVITHGFGGKGSLQWMVRLKNEILKLVSRCLILILNTCFFAFHC